MAREHVLEVVVQVIGHEQPLALASRRWSSWVPNRAAPHFLQVLCEGRVVALVFQPQGVLDRWDNGFSATWCCGLGWLVELTPEID